MVANPGVLCPNRTQRASDEIADQAFQRGSFGFAFLASMEAVRASREICSTSSRETDPPAQPEIFRIAASPRALSLPREGINSAAHSAAHWTSSFLSIWAREAIQNSTVPAASSFGLFQTSRSSRFVFFAL